MPVRLLFLNTRDLCGADVAVHLTLMQSLHPDEVEVFVISNSEASDASEMEARFRSMPHVRCTFMPLGKPADALAGRSLPGRLLAYVPSLLSLVRVVRFIRKHRIQIVHATDRPRDASFASLVARLAGAVSVVHMHAHVAGLSRPTLWGMQKATAVFAVSDAIKRALVEIGIDAAKIRTLYNAVDPVFFDADQQTAPTPSVRARFGIPDTAPLVGIAARMNPWKGQFELIGATSLLRDEFPDLHVLILGSNVPEMRAEYEKRAAEGGVSGRIHFAGFQRDVRPFLKELDLFVHPSYGEPFGLSIVEAMAMRKPVIACNSGGVPEIITHGVDGWLVEERSASAVADGIRLLLNDRDLARQMGVRARETVCSRFTPEHQARDAVRLYSELVKAA